MANLTVVMRYFTESNIQCLKQCASRLPQISKQLTSRKSIALKDLPIRCGSLRATASQTHSFHQGLYSSTAFSRHSPGKLYFIHPANNSLYTSRNVTKYLPSLLNGQVHFISTTPCLNNQSSTSTNASNVQSHPTPDSESAAEGQKEQSQKKESWWRGKNSWRLGLIFLGGACITWAIGLVNIWGAPQLDPDGNEIQDEFSEMSTAWAYLRRTWKEMNIFKKKIQDPSREKLLPDPLSYPYIQPPYTLVIELTGVLIHPDWTYNTGWRFKKRPGIDYFLQQVGPPLFEVVIYSSESGMTADPLVNHLDPQGYIMYRLYRDATRYMDGHHLKDLSCLNRDMSRIIMLDCNKDSVSLQPRNAVVLKKWSGEDGDRTLVDLAHFLKTIAASGVDDIRPVIDYYSQFDDPLLAFKENQRKLQEEEEARAKKAKEETQKKSWLSGFSKR